jgi:hypothetical protein
VIEKGVAQQKAPERNKIRNDYRVAAELYLFPKKRKISIKYENNGKMVVVTIFGFGS